MYKKFEKRSLKYTNSKVNSINIIKITDTEIQGTKTITTNKNRNSTSSNEEILNTELLCKFE